MATAKQLEELRAMSDVDVAAIAYVEAAEGDLSQALQWADTDLLRTEIALAEARNAISYGYVRASPSSAGDSTRR